MDLRLRLRHWQARRAVETSERERMAFLGRTPAPNPPELLAPTRCRVLRPFFIAGVRVEKDAIVTLPLHDAQSMAALKRIELL